MNGTAKTNIAIAGYYGYGNAGDELILSSIISELNENKRFSGDIVVLSGNPSQTSDWFKVKAIPRFNFIRVFMALRKASWFILGGGGLLQDKTGPFTLFYYLGLVMLAWVAGSKILVYAIGVEGKPKLIGRRLISFVFKVTKPVLTVRDEESVRDLEYCGIDPSGIKVVNDPCFRLAGVAGDTVRPRNLYRKDMKVLFVPRGITGGATVLKPYAMAAAIDEMVLKAGFTRVGLAAFDEKLDTGYAKELKSLLCATADFISWNNPEDIIGIVRNYELVVSMRLHGLILALLNKCPAVAIGSLPKIERFARQWRLEHLMPGEFSPEALVKAGKKAMTNSYSNRTAFTDMPDKQGLRNLIYF